VCVTRSGGKKNMREMKRGKKIVNLILSHVTPSFLLMELSNWTLKALIVPYPKKKKRVL
jgi:hypothetical protein